MHNPYSHRPWTGIGELRAEQLLPKQGLQHTHTHTVAARRPRLFLVLVKFAREPGKEVGRYPKGREVTSCPE